MGTLSTESYNLIKLMFAENISWDKALILSSIKGEYDPYEGCWEEEDWN